MKATPITGQSAQAPSIGAALPEFVDAPLTRTDFVRYQGASGDMNPLHHDDERARAAGFPSVYAVGMLAAGVLGSWVADQFGPENIRRFAVRFREQAWPGDVITYGGTVVGVRTGDGGERLMDLELRASRQTGADHLVGEATVAVAGPGVARRVSLSSGAITLVGDRWDAEDPRGTVLLLHGGGQTRHSWSGTGQRLAASHWNALSLDARGHGDSDWAGSGQYSLDALVADLEALVATLPEPPVLVGASMGGSTSLVAQGERALGRALVLVDIVPKIETEGVERIVSFMNSAPDGFGSLEEAAEAVRAYNPHRSRPATAEGLRKNLRQRGDRWYWHWDPDFLRIGTRVSDPRRIRDAARAITVPTLLVRGQHSDVVSPEGVADLLELIPHAEYIDVTDTGHMVAGDDNDVFAGSLLRFLDGL